jgi:phospholipid/cholesterol/gamma-HCH transport system permease protein
MITREQQFYDPPVNAIAALGRHVIGACQGTGLALLLLLGAMANVPHAFSRKNRADVMQQLYIVGIKSLGVVSVVGTFTGMILALQMGLGLRLFGQEYLVSTLVCNGILREMGPFMTGLVVAASVGSAIAAQMGTMTVSEEIAALDVMGIDPRRYLMMPRLVALAVMLPLLTVYVDVIGLAGGAVVAASMLGVSPETYYDTAFDFSYNKDLYVGVLKAFLFGLVIVCVSCYQGFSTTEGAVGVGRATRRTVIVSFLLILALGYVVTRLCYP